MSTRYPLGPRIKVHVTKEDVTNGITGDSTRCMIADAIKRAVPKATRVAVDVQTCRFSDLEKGHRYVYLTPYSAQLALMQFDEGQRPDAFSFLLKNAHVTRAGVSAVTKETRKKSAEKNKKRNKGNPAQTPARAALSASHSRSGSVPRRVGGRRPPQLRMMRQFGVRAFRGASVKRLQSDAELVARIDMDKGRSD